MKGLYRSLIIFFSAFTFLLVVVLAFASMYFFNRIDRDLPRIEKISDYNPKAVSQIFSSEGTLIAEVWDERRYPLDFADIPENVRNAFLAAEDASFYSHSGIDYLSIFRAAWKNITARKTKQGASTITQQIVKQLLLSREKTYERKLKEALLSYRLERYLSKDEILAIYLNQIFLGKGAYGVKAAGFAHFRKDIQDLTIAEAAFLGGLPKKPSELSRAENLPEAIVRQKYVLKQMLEKKFITKDQYNEALTQDLNIQYQDDENIYHAPYFASYAIKEAEELIQKQFPEYSLRDPGGFQIHTTLELEAYQASEKAARDGLKAVDKRQGWRGPVGNIKDAGGGASTKWDEVENLADLRDDRIYRALVTGIDSKAKVVQLRMGKVKASVSLRNIAWAQTRVTLDNVNHALKRFRRAPELDITPGSIIEVSKSKVDKEGGRPPKFEFILDQTPLAQVAMAALNVHNGNVLTLIGGFDYKSSKFNRATQAHLQPGSAFKPFVYLTAIDRLGLTPSSLVPDEPISFPTPEGLWTPQNFDKKYLGPITLRTALQRSRNVVSVHLLHRAGIDNVISLAKGFGISTEIPRNMSISLGTPEVKLIDMVRAYAGFANAGYVPKVRSIERIVDRQGKTIIEVQPELKEVVDSRSAFILQHIMRGVVDRGTAQIIKKLERPTAGKTGTTNDHMDAWFIGYTPDVVAGVWVGFDVKRSLGRRETGGMAAAPIFLDFMQRYLKDSPVADFIPPDGVTPVAINVNTGVPVPPGTEGAFIEYFKTESLKERDQYDFYGSSEIIPRSAEDSDYLKSSDF